MDYLKELSNYCDIYYLCDGTVDIRYLEEIKKIAKDAWCEEHRGYDFYSWKLLIDRIGEEVLTKYDEIVFANDSCFCVNSFEKVFNEMDEKKYDYWGLIATDEQNIRTVYSFDKYYDYKWNSKYFCIGSFFWAVNKKTMEEKFFKSFITSIFPRTKRENVCLDYEMKIIKLMKNNGKRVGTYCKNVYRYSTMYSADAFNLIKNGMPLLKVRIFIDNIGEIKNIDEIYKATIPFCSFDYGKYIQEVRKERKIQHGNAVDDRATKLGLKNFIIEEANRYRKKDELFISNFYKFIKYCLKSGAPPEKIDRPFHRYPPYGGLHPIHIKNYYKNQDELIDKYCRQKTAVIFFNIMRQLVGGGMLSIERFVRKTKELLEPEEVSVIVCGLPLDNACIKNPFFNYEIPPIDFNYLSKKYFPEKLYLNIPEAFVPDFLQKMTSEIVQWLWAIKELHINIMNQNDDLMPDQNYIEDLRTLCNGNLTITAAHSKYCTDAKRLQYNAPMYRLTPFLPVFYRIPFEEKKNIIVLSPDINEYRSTIISLLKTDLPNYKLVTVNQMKLDDYKKLISKAKFTISFGEGYDGYFIEPYLSNSIGFTVFNRTFFPQDFPEFLTIFKTWEEMLHQIVGVIKTIGEDRMLYSETSKEMEKIIATYTNNEVSNEDLLSYYRSVGLLH